MSTADALLAALWAGLTAYAVLGGADFGAGVLHLLAPRGRPGARRRRAITRAIGPVWEASHVWLIFFLTGLLTMFPLAFSALGSALLVPGALALVGIVVRGAAFAFGGHLGAADRARRPVRVAFGLASAATPVVFGAAAAGLARQRVLIDAGGGVPAGGGTALWLGPFQAEVGLLALTACTVLAATFLTVASGRHDERTLAVGFRSWALRATVATVVLAVVGLPLAAATARRLFDGLIGRGLPAVLLAGVAFAVALVAMLLARDVLARGALVVAVSGLVWGWGLAQFPRLVARSVTVANAAAAPAELHAVAISLLAGAVLLAPSLWFLHRAFRDRSPEVLR